MCLVWERFPNVSPSAWYNTLFHYSRHGIHTLVLWSLSNIIFFLVIGDFSTNRLSLFLRLCSPIFFFYFFGFRDEFFFFLKGGETKQMEKIIGLHHTFTTCTRHQSPVRFVWYDLGFPKILDYLFSFFFETSQVFSGDYIISSFERHFPSRLWRTV